MKFLQLFALFAVAAPCFAQNATPTPKNTFNGFGNTLLDKRPNNVRVATPAPFVSSLPPRGSGNPSSPGATGLNFQAKTVANGGGITSTTAPGSVAPTKTETLANHHVLEVDIHNFSNQPANAHFDWFFVAVGSNGRYVWDQGDRDVSLAAGGAQTETLESRPIERQTINETHIETRVETIRDPNTGNSRTFVTRVPISTRRQTGSQPDGWIVRMSVGGLLFKVQASNAFYEQVGRDQAQLNGLLKVKPTP